MSKFVESIKNVIKDYHPANSIIKTNERNEEKNTAAIDYIGTKYDDASNQKQSKSNLLSYYQGNEFNLKVENHGNVSFVTTVDDIHSDIDDDERKLISSNKYGNEVIEYNKKKEIVNFLASTDKTTLLYFILSSLFIPLVLFHDIYLSTNISQDENYVHLGKNKFTFLNFFRIYYIFPLGTNILLFVSAILGMVVVLFIYSALRIRLGIKSLTENVKSSVCIILSSLFGLLSFTILLIFAINPLIGGFVFWDESMTNKIGMSLVELLFIVRIGLTLAWVFLLLVLSFIRYDYIEREHSPEEIELFDIWFKYSLVFMLYLFFLSVTYTIVRYRGSGVMNTLEKTDSLEKLSEYFLSIIPYILNFLMDVNIYVFGFLLFKSRIGLYFTKQENPIKEAKKNEL